MSAGDGLIRCLVAGIALFGHLSICPKLFWKLNFCEQETQTLSRIGKVVIMLANCLEVYSSLHTWKCILSGWTRSLLQSSTIPMGLFNWAVQNTLSVEAVWVQQWRHLGFVDEEQKECQIDMKWCFLRWMMIGGQSDGWLGGLLLRKHSCEYLSWLFSAVVKLAQIWFL